MQHTHLTSAEVSTLLIYIQWKSIVSSRQSNRFAMVGVCFLNGEHLILELNLIWWKAPLQMHREGNFEYSISECLSRGPVDACSMRMAQKDEADMERGYSEGYWDIVGSCWRKGGGCATLQSGFSSAWSQYVYIFILKPEINSGYFPKTQHKGGHRLKKTSRSHTCKSTTLRLCDTEEKRQDISLPERSLWCDKHTNMEYNFN